jgi:transcriptional regulator with XRE-family HTH domain
MQNYWITKIEKRRLELEMSQCELSLSSGVSQPLISAYELMKNIPCKKNLEKLAKTLGVNEWRELYGCLLAEGDKPRLTRTRNRQVKNAAWWE